MAAVIENESNIGVKPSDRTPSPEPSYVEDLLERYHQEKNGHVSFIVNYDLPTGFIAYNSSLPFDCTLDGRQLKGISATRVDKVLDETSFKTKFFQGSLDQVSRQVPDSPTFDLQDPFGIKIKGEIIIGGVRVKVLKRDPLETTYLTELYRGTDLANMRRFYVSPEKMKDLRLMEWNGQILVTPRPQGKYIQTLPNGEQQEIDAGKGIITYLTVSCLEELQDTDLYSAKVLGGLKLATKNPEGAVWVGPNHLTPLPDGKVGMDLHYGFDGPDENGLYLRHYFGAHTEFNPFKGEAAFPKVVLTRADFPEGKAKVIHGNGKELEDIAFFVGSQNIGNGLIVARSGLSDFNDGIMIRTWP